MSTKANHMIEQLFPISADSITKVHCVSINRNLVVDIKGKRCLIKGKLFNQLMLTPGKYENVAIVNVEGFDLPLVKTLKF